MADRSGDRGADPGGRGEAHELVSGNRSKLDALAEALLEEETLDGERVDEILAAASEARRAGSRGYVPERFC